ncbi:MAG: ATP-dependent DNA ligase [Kaiparowitsia implicata GSE-PSE-MK54-09C]|jgi:DNA ligase-1|nr:ATP-dependent DNA ligase [Kaiparowitsia implicata GSE-PSE-MK54-09C]
MKRFAHLFQQVDATPSTNAKVAALAAYFQEESPHNAVWALYLLMGKTRKRLVTSRVLRDAYLSISEIPEWLFEECYAQVGDSAEVIALLLQQQPELIQSAAEIPLAVWMEEILPKVKMVEQEDDLQRLIVSWWRSLHPFEAFILNKLLTGAFRFGASAKLVIKGLAAASDISEPELAHRLMGDFAPTVAFYQQLVQEGDGEVAPSRPYPFFLASSLEEDRFVEEDLSHWQAEWKWDGIRAQLIRREDESSIWSRGEDLITHQFPELADSLAQWPNGTVLDGEILCWTEAEGDRPMNFNALQKRLGRKRVTAKTMAEYPVCFMAYDLLEQAGQDLRTLPLSDRRSRLLGLLETIAPPQMRPSETLNFDTWAEIQTLRERSRDRGAEGLMLKALDSPYLVGRKRGHWWKYKVEPMTLDAVLIYAQAGSGKRANLFTDYTFALWQDAELVTFAKAYSGLDNKEIDALDKWIRQHTIEKFGPVRAVEPIQVFEIGFEGIAESKRHKSGISVRFPRILRWRTDKPAAEADTLATARQILTQHG